MKPGLGLAKPLRTVPTNWMLSESIFSHCLTSTPLLDAIAIASLLKTTAASHAPTSAAAAKPSIATSMSVKLVIAVSAPESITLKPATSVEVANEPAILSIVAPATVEIPASSRLSVLTTDAVPRLDTSKITLDGPKSLLVPAAVTILALSPIETFATP